MPPQLGYDVESPERLSVKLPREALRSRRRLTVNQTALVEAAGGEVAVSGTFVRNLREAALQSPRSYELVLTLAAEAWDEAIGHDGAESSTALLAAVHSDQDEPGGWNAVVQPALQPRHIVRLDDVTLILTLESFADYQISMPETLRLVLPPAAVASRQTVVANESFVVRPTAGFATLNGSLLDELSEGYLCSPPALLLDVRLHGDTWSPNVTEHNSTLMRALVAGFKAKTKR